MKISREVALKVLLPNPSQSRQVLRRLRDGGFPIVPLEALPTAGPYGLVTEAIRITARERHLLRHLPLHDHSAAIAGIVDRTERTVDNILGRLEGRCGVHSRHRLLLRALEMGALRLKSGPVRKGLIARAGGRGLLLRSAPPLPTLLAEASDHASVLKVKVTAAAPSDRTDVEEYLVTSGFPVLRGDAIVWVARSGEAAKAWEITPRELQVLEELTRHDHSLSLAHALGVSEGTIDDHVSHLERKLGVGSRHRLVAMSILLGILRPVPHP
jgi:DNA-binding CsgD family transcriptional regulator